VKLRKIYHCSADRARQSWEKEHLQETAAAGAKNGKAIGESCAQAAQDCNRVEMLSEGLLRLDNSISINKLPAIDGAGWNEADCR
jgi:hypothetical protein